MRAQSARRREKYSDGVGKLHRYNRGGNSHSYNHGETPIVVRLMKNVKNIGSLTKRAEIPSGMIFPPLKWWANLVSAHRFNGGEFVRRDGPSKLSENQNISNLRLLSVFFSFPPPSPRQRGKTRCLPRQRGKNECSPPLARVGGWILAP